MSLTFVVEGRPVPQGSMTASYNRKLGVAHVHHVQGTALAMWRASIREAAKQAGATLSPQPLVVRVTFGMPRPKSHMQWRAGKYVPKMQHYYDRPSSAPDLDKLVRAVLDALTGLCYPDDSQVVVIHAEKVYGDTTEIEVGDVIDSPQRALPFGMEEDETAHPRAG